MTIRATLADFANVHINTEALRRIARSNRLRCFPISVRLVCAKYIQNSLQSLLQRNQIGRKVRHAQHRMLKATKSKNQIQCRNDGGILELAGTGGTGIKLQEEQNNQGKSSVKTGAKGIVQVWLAIFLRSSSSEQLSSNRCSVSSLDFTSFFLSRLQKQSSVS